MRSFPSSVFGVLTSGIQSEYVRVSVKDAGGTFRDLTTYPGFNAVADVTWAENVSDPHMTCDITLLREMNKLSLSPMIAASALNKGFNPAGAFVALLTLTAEVLVECAITAMDHPPVSGDWFEVFRGKIDSLDTANGDNIRIACRSMGGRLAQQFIKTELVYSYAANGGVAVPLRIWEPQIPVVLNVTYCLPATRGAANGTTAADPGFNKFFKCSQSGTTGTTEPVWTTGSGITDGTAKWDYIGAPTTSGNPVEQVMQNLLNDHKASGDPTVTLYTPTSPSWAIRQYIQQREFVLDAVRKLATQIGWDLRYKWRSGTSQFELTFYQPTRVSPTVNYSFNPWDYSNPTKLSVEIANIRNSWRVVYSDRADLWPDGQPKRKVVEVSDSASITKYGELWAEIQEDETSQIDSSTEATALANAALSDCKEPTAELSTVLTRGFPWVEINDYVTFQANGLHFDSDQSLAVTGWSQNYDGKRLRTTLETRGLPTIGASTYLGATVHPRIPVRNLPPPLTVSFVGPETPNTLISSTVGGTSLTNTVSTIDKSKFTGGETEVHLYPVPNTTLGAGTLKTLAPSSQSKITMGDLVPGKTYYGKTVVRAYHKNRMVRGQPSKEFSVVAGRAKAGHYDAGSTPGILPLNGNFEHASEPLTDAPFDHWFVFDAAGGLDTKPTVWTTSGGPESVTYGTDSARGNFVLLRPGGGPARGAIRTSIFPVPRNVSDVELRLSIKRSGTSSAANEALWIKVEWFSTSGGSVVATTTRQLLADTTVLPDTSWNQYDIGLGFTGLVDTYNFMRVSFYRGNAAVADAFGTIEWSISDVTLEFASARRWIAPTLINSWANYGAPDGPVGYMKDRNGIVHIRGVVYRTVAGYASITMFVLPVGYRPMSRGYINWAAYGNDRWCSLYVDSSGNVGCYTADSATPEAFIDFGEVVFDPR